MDIQYIREFISVAKTCNLPLAADQHYISPSLLSLHIRKIEEELGYPLFDRTSRSMLLNKQGQFFLLYAKKIVSAYDEYLNRSAKALDNRFRQLHIGLIGSVAQTTTENLIADFYKDHPDVRLYVKSRDYPQILTNFLSTGQCDFVFLYDSDTHMEGITVVPLFTDTLVAVVSPEHPLSSKTEVSANDLRSESILMQNTDIKINQKITQFFSEQGTTLNLAFAVNSHSLMEDMLEVNSGIGLMMQSSAERMRNKNLSVLPVTPALTMEFSMLYIDRKQSSMEEMLFLDFVRRKFDLPKV